MNQEGAHVPPEFLHFFARDFEDSPKLSPYQKEERDTGMGERGYRRASEHQHTHLVHQEGAHMPPTDQAQLAAAPVVVQLPDRGQRHIPATVGAHMYVCVCACVRARTRVSMCACVCVLRCSRGTARQENMGFQLLGHGCAVRCSSTTLLETRGRRKVKGTRTAVPPHPPIIHRCCQDSSLTHPQ